MDSIVSPDLYNCKHVNNLWIDLINSVGMVKAKQAIQQSLDLQKMQGSSETLPLLLVRTCGIGLVLHSSVNKSLRLPTYEKNIILLYDSSFQHIQLLKSTY